MQKEYCEALELGLCIKRNVFSTEKGIYTIKIVAYRNDIYFFKWKNTKLVECLNLSEMERQPRVL